MSSALADLLRKARQKQGLSFRALASLVGVGAPFLCDLEKGVREPSEPTVQALAHHLRLDSDHLWAAMGRLPPDLQDRLMERPDAIAKIRRLLAGRLVRREGR